MALPVLLVVTKDGARELSSALISSHVVFEELSEAEALSAIEACRGEILIVDPARADAPALLESARRARLQVIAYLPQALTDAELAQVSGLPSAGSPRELMGRIAAAERTLFATRDDSSTLVRRARISDALIRFAQAVALKLETDELSHEVSRRTRELVEADEVRLFLVDPWTGELCCEGTQLEPGEGLSGRAARNAAPLQEADADGCSLIAAPLLLAGDVLGVLEAKRGAGRPPFTAQSLALLQELVPHVAIAAHNAQVTERLRRMQDQQLRINEELEKKVQERSAQISQAKRELEASIDAISDPIALLDGFTVRRANLAYARLAKVPVKQVVGRKCHELLAGRASPCPGCPLVTSVPSNTPLRAELPFSERTFAMTAFWLSDDPDERNVVVTYEDVTAQRALEGKLRESERLASIGELASGAAHEINNPLGFVVSNLGSLRGLLEELAENGAERALIKEGLEMVDDSLGGARRVQDIIRALRQLSKQEVGTAEDADVNESCRRAAKQEHGIRPAQLSLELSATVSAQIAALHLDQALGHILKNAGQAVSGTQRILVRTRDQGARVVVEVHDEGVGIAPEHLARIFDPFFTTRGIGKGTGLGLTAAYGIIKRAGGEIEVRSEPGQGSVFTVSLPAAQKRADTEEPDMGLEVAVALAQEAVTAS